MKTVLAARCPGCGGVRQVKIVSMKDGSAALTCQRCNRSWTEGYISDKDDKVEQLIKIVKDSGMTADEFERGLAEDPGSELDESGGGSRIPESIC